MSHMFHFAQAFNCDLSQWDLSGVTDMEYMFTDAKSFKQQLCGLFWVHSKAKKDFMFGGSSGSISPKVCTPAPTPATTQVTRHHATRRPLPERELIVRTPIATSVSTSAFTLTILSKTTCPKCSTFAISGRVSCCAPGGAWYKNCGGAANKNVDHMWFEGVEACKRKFNANVYYYYYL